MNRTGRDPVLQHVFQFPGRATRAIVDLDAIAANVSRVAEHIGPDRPIRAVVKGNGYGHGAMMTAETALAAGATALAVATVGEAAQLRAAFPSQSILIMGPTDASEIDRAIGLDAEITIGDQVTVPELISRAQALGTRVRVHLKIDTGMHRFGVLPEDARETLDAIASSQTIELVGICTHHAAADEPGRGIAGDQGTLFAELMRQLAPAGLDAHHANSAAALSLVPPLTGSVRLGIAMYGLAPGPDVPLLDGMRPALSVVSRLQRAHVAESGAGVSYGHTYKVQSSERLGLVPVGYADGYRRTASNRGWMRLGEATLPVRGRVCMDQTVLGNLPDVAKPGDIVGIAGPAAAGPSLDELAAWGGTINYEVATSLSARVPRYYLRNGRVVAALIEDTLTRYD